VTKVRPFHTGLHTSDWHRYALARLEVSMEIRSVPTIELDPMHRLNIPKSVFPEDHTLSKKLADRCPVLTARTSPLLVSVLRSLNPALSQCQ
jgi:hypothetical protein